MVVLFKKDNTLYVKCLLNLKKPIVHQNKVFNSGLTTLYLLPEEVNTILAANGNIKFWNGKKYIKLNLGQFNDVMKNKKLKVEVMKEEKQPEVKKPEQNKKQRHKNNNQQQEQGGDK